MYRWVCLWSISFFIAVSRICTSRLCRVVNGSMLFVQEILGTSPHGPSKTRQWKVSATLRCSRPKRQRREALQKSRPLSACKTGSLIGIVAPPQFVVHLQSYVKNGDNWQPREQRRRGFAPYDSLALKLWVPT